MNSRDELLNLTDFFKIESEVKLASLGNIRLATLSGQCEPLHLVLQSQVYSDHQVIIPQVLELHNLSVRVIIEEELEPALIVICGEWLIGGTTVQLNMNYMHDTSQFSLSGEIGSINQNFKALINDLTTLPLPVASKFSSSHQNLKIAGIVSDPSANGVMIISASFNSGNSAFLILERDNGTLETAVAVDLASVPLSDVIESVTGIDVSSVPFIGSLTLPEMGMAVSTGPISSELVQECFNNSITLGCYGDSIPSDFSGFVHFNSNNIFEFAYRNNTALFTSKQGSFEMKKLLVPITDISRIQVPSEIGDISDVNIIDFGLDLTKDTAFVTAELRRTLSLFNDLLSIDTTSVTLTTVDGGFSYDILGKVILANASINIELSYSPVSNLLKFASELSAPSFNIGGFISELTPLTLPMADSFQSSHQRIKMAGSVATDDLSNGIAVISASVDSINNAYLILERVNGTLETAVAVDLASVPLRNMIESITEHDASSAASAPFIGSWTLPEIGLAVSTAPISSELLQNCLDNSLPLRCYGDSIPAGLSGFIRLSANNIFKLAYHNNTASFAIKRGSVNIRDLLRLFPVVDVSSIRVPSIIRDILDIDIKNFGFDLTSSTTFITAELGRRLNFFNNLLSLDSPSVTLTTIDGEFSYEILGSIRLLADTLVDMKLSYSPDSNSFTLSSDVSAPSLSIGDLVSELTSLSLTLADKFTFSQQKIKIAGLVDDRMNGIIVISASVDSPSSNVFLILKNNNGTLETAVAIDIASVPLSDVIESVTGLDISALPFIGSLTLPEMALAVSTGQISSELVQECFESSLTLRCYGDRIPAGFSGFIHLTSNNIFELAYHNNTVSFTIKRGSMNVRDLLRQIPVVNVLSIKVPSILRDILDIDITNFGFDLTTNTTFITVELGRRLSFFNNLLSIDTTSVTLTAVDGDFSYDILGNITLANTLINIKLGYSSVSNQLTFFSDISAPLLSIESLVSEFTSLSLPLPGRFRSSHQRVKIAGSVDNQSNGIVIISVSIASNHRAFLILERDNGTLETAVAIDIASVPLSDVIESVTGIDVSSVPFIGSLRLPEMGMAVSSDRISSRLLDQCFTNTMLLECYDTTIPSGFSGFVDFDFASHVFNITHRDEVLRFSTKGREVSVRNVLDLILSPVDFTRINLPGIFDDIFDIDINDFGVNLTSNDLFIDFELGNTVQLFNGLIQITSPTVSLEVSLPSNDVSVDFRHGSMVLGDISFSFSVTKDASQKYSLKACTNFMSLQSILSSFSAKLLPNQLQQVIESLPLLNSVGIRDLSMVVPLDAAFQQVFLTGTPEIAGFSLVEMSATIFRDDSGGVDMIYELDFSNSNFANILGEIAPFAKGILKLIPFLNQDLGISVLFSPVHKTDIKLAHDDIQGLDIRKGITIQAEIPFPSGDKCDADLFCATAKRLLPADTVLNIASTINNAASFHLIASLTGNINLSGGLTITHAGVELRVGEDTSIGIIGKMSLQNPRLDFTIRIYHSLTGIVLEIIAAGCWQSAFELPIDVCDMHGSIGFAASAITELSIGGEIRLGGLLGCNEGRLLTARGYVGLNTIEPRNNYYYAEFPQDLTFSNLLQIFCIEVSEIPPPIANTGLESGFQTSFTAGKTGKSIPEIDLYIPSGFQLNGTLNIFGFRVSANISISHTEGLYAAIALQPLTIGSLFGMYVSRSDRSRGPYLIADLRADQIPRVEASGYLQVLGISVGASLSLSAESVSTTIEGSILGIVEATISLTAPYSLSFSGLDFQANGTFKSSIHEVIESVIRNAADAVADVASVALNAAKSVLNAASDAFEDASRVLRNARRELDNAQEAFDDAADEVDRWIDKADSICHTRSCGSGKFLKNWRSYRGYAQKLKLQNLRHDSRYQQGVAKKTEECMLLNEGYKWHNRKR